MYRRRGYNYTATLTLKPKVRADTPSGHQSNLSEELGAVSMAGGCQHGRHGRRETGLSAAATRREDEPELGRIPAES